MLRGLSFFFFFFFFLNLFIESFSILFLSFCSLSLTFLFTTVWNQFLSTKKPPSSTETKRKPERTGVVSVAIIKMPVSFCKKIMIIL